MGDPDSRPGDGADRTPGFADLVASVILLGVAIVLGLTGAMATWLVAESLAPACTFERVIGAAEPITSVAIIACATFAVTQRRRLRVTGSPAAAIAVGGVIVASGIAGWIAYVGAPTMCGV